MRPFAVFDERHKPPRRRDGRPRQTGTVRPDRREDVRERWEKQVGAGGEQCGPARSRELARGEIERRKSERVSACGDDAVGLRDVTADLPDDRDEHGKQGRVEELERETEVPVGVPGEIRKAFRDEARIRDEGRLDAAAKLGELPGEKRSDRQRLQREKRYDGEEIDRKTTIRGVADPKSMGDRLSWRWLCLPLSSKCDRSETSGDRLGLTDLELLGRHAHVDLDTP